MRLSTIHAAIGLALSATSAQAVHLSTNGTGQVLIFPYYTVRNGFSTLVSIDNTQNNTKAVKVRFREGLNGREVLNFNLFLSPNDTWTSAVVETANGARLITNDNSCVTPADLFSTIPAKPDGVDTRTDPNGLPLNHFKNYNYTSLFPDAASLASMDRTREGFFEVVEMGVIDPNLSGHAALAVGYVKQNAAGMPVNCPAMDNLDDFPGNPNVTRFPDIGATLLSPPTGGLRGRASLIGAATGANYSFSPTALDAWSSRVVYSYAGNTSASPGDAFPPTSTVVTAAGAIVANWGNGTDAVSAVLMRDKVSNEFVLDSGTRSQTDWIVTFPTKPFYTIGNSTTATRAPFSSVFSSNGTGACDPYTLAVFDREASNNQPAQVFPNPTLPPPPPPLQICWVANVIPFGASLLASRALADPLKNGVQGTTTLPGPGTTPILRGVRQGPNGKLMLQFGQGLQHLTPISAVLVSPTGTRTPIAGRHFGFPVIGVMLHNYQNTNVVSNYGGVVEHSYSNRIE